MCCANSKDTDPAVDRMRGAALKNMFPPLEA